ncbi:MAG: mycothiol synthase [Acidimicrobiia bacterium]|nr:mycothiol synthase [Acidimicrobiia bacterium]
MGHQSEPTDRPAATTATVTLDGAVGRAERGRPGWEIELSAGTGRLGVDTATALLVELVASIARAGGGTVRWRVPEPTPEHSRIARSAGLGGDRALWEMRRSLPAPPPEPPLDTRPFVVGFDDDEWLRVNNAAFDWHPEQGGWGRSELTAQVDEPWFDPEGFLLHPASEAGDPIDGFCWTKVHAGLEPPIGEIFAVAVDPAAAGTGLGRRLVLAGFDHLHRSGLAEVMLYTESDNLPAVGLYRSLGLTVHHEVRVFEREVEPQMPVPTSVPMP